MAVYPSKLSIFALGFAIGVIIAFAVTVSKNGPKSFNSVQSMGVSKAYHIDSEILAFNEWLKRTGYIRASVDYDLFSYSGNKSLNQYLESQLMKFKVNVMCVMFVKNINNAYAAANTWMKHCNSYKFYGMKPEKYLEVKVLRPKNSWHYLCEVIRQLDSSTENYMWVLFVPDDIYAIPENLRHYVFNKSSKGHFYLGQKAIFWNEHYNLGQAGYVLSRGSIKALAQRFNTSQSCLSSGKYWKNEDYYLGKYLSELGVRPTDTRDRMGRGRFHVFTPSQLMSPGEEQILSKYWKFNAYPVIQGKDCCSPQSITFQGTNKDYIYFYHYILYNLHVQRKPGKLGNVKSRVFTPSEQVWQQFVKDELGPNVNLTTITAKKYYQLWSDKIDSPSIFNKKLRALFVGDSDD